MIFTYLGPIFGANQKLKKRDGIISWSSFIKVVTEMGYHAVPFPRKHSTSSDRMLSHCDPAPAAARQRTSGRQP